MGSTRFTSASSEYSYSTSPPPGDVDYSAGGWVRFASRSHGMACFSIGPTSGDWPGSYDVIHLLGGSADYWSLTCAVGYTEANASYGPSAVASDTWYHVMLVAEGSTTLLYVDGVQRVSVSHTRTSRVDAGHLRLGNSTVSWFTHLNGEMAGWKVWDRALTAGQVAAEAWSYMPVTTHNLRAAWPLLPGGRTGDWGGLALTLTEVNTPTDGTAEPPPIAFRRPPLLGPVEASASGAISGTSTGAATTAGTIRGDTALAAAVTGAATTAGAMTGEALRAGSATGAATTAGALSGGGDIAAAVSASATVAGAMTGEALVSGSATGAATVSGTMSAGAISGSATGLASLAATIIGTGLLVASATGAAATSGTLDVGMAGAVAGSATASGTLSADAAIAGASSGLSTVTGSVSGETLGTITVADWSTSVTLVAGSEWRLTLTGPSADAPRARVVLKFLDCS